MKGLFIAFEFILTHNAQNTESGIEKKVKKQFETLSNAGIEMTFLNPYAKSKIMSRRFRKRLPFFFLTGWDDNLMMKKNIDFLYIRKPWHMDGDLIIHLKRFRKLNPLAKVVLEIPTYPYDQECHEIINYPLVLKDKFWRRYLKKYVDRIVTYSDDDEIFGIPTLKISNAMDVSDLKIANIKEYNSAEIHIMMCATLCYWHGYDRAIIGLRDYYNNGGTTNFILHVVGDGEERPKYESLRKDLHLEEHVIIHGKKFGKDLDHIYSVCDIAFDSMGRHRSGVEYNSSLKGKEYASKGLPSVSGVKTELDKANDFPYYYRVPANDSPINFDEILDFCNKCYSKPVNDVRKDIISYASNHFSYEATLKPVIFFAINK